MTARKIIVADDDTEDKTILQDAMEKLQESPVLTLAENGRQVWEILEEDFGLGILPCLVVLDLNMPEMNGAQTLEKMKTDERFKNIPVIIYSTSITPAEKQRCLSLGAHAYITKPISFSESIETAKALLQFCNPSAASSQTPLASP